ncbi:MAG: neutral/alkaline non-lysosomal ceramidase N-terminal domain-containing protein [Myxococcota bacterium]
MSAAMTCQHGADHLGPPARLRRLMATAALLLGLGCTSVRGSLPEPEPRAPVTASETGWLAGAAEIDITPPPGYAMGGHSLEGAVGFGVWTRLRAQALYFEDTRGVPLVLVACDLWAVEAGLVDRVAQRLREHPGLEHIGREHLIIAATHTHHSPGLFSTGLAYSRYAAADSGHDPVLFEALANRLATAIAEAAASRRPARIQHHTVALPAVARNRSVEAFLHDPEAPALLSTNAGLPGCRGQPSSGGVDPCHAVEPLVETLHVVDAADGRNIAVAGVFAMHPTAMPKTTELYHGDAFGIASTRAQTQLADPEHGEPVVALFNGAQGDVSPNWDPQGRPSTIELGHALGRALVDAIETPGTPVEGEIEVAFAWQTLAGQRFEDAEGTPLRTARSARSGKGQFGGAEDGRTWLFERGWREGKRNKRRRNNGQGNKRAPFPWPLSWLTPPPGSMPKAVPLSVASLGHVTLLGLPGEFSTVLGQRIGTRVGAGLPDDRVVVRLGLAGGYLSYFTTPEEYGAQHYEGASMLYGEHAGVLITERLAELAASPRVERPPDFRYRPGPRRDWAMDRGRQRALLEIEDRIAVQLDTGPPPGLPRFYLWDTAPRWPSDDPHALTSPRVRVQAWHDDQGWQDYAPGGIPVDDRTGTLALMLTHVQDDAWRWGVWWLEPGASPGQPLRFIVETVGVGTTCSEPFSTDQWFRPTGPGVLDVRPCEAPAQ